MTEAGSRWRRVLGVALGVVALLVGAAFGVLQVPRPGPPADADYMARVPNAANGRMHELAADAQGHWAVQILADIQDGFPYVPRILEEAQKQSVQAIVIAGDLATGDGGVHLSLLLDELRVHPPPAPLFAVPGNHDNLSEANRAQFDAAFGGSEFEFRIGATRFIGVDSNTPESRVQAMRLLRARVRTASELGERIVVVCHHSPLDWASYPGSGGVDAELSDLLRQPEIALVLSGHVHREKSSRLGEARFVTAPASGDKSKGASQALVSYLLLRRNGEHFELERHQFPRGNGLELDAQLRHNLYAHVQPWLRGLLHGDGDQPEVARDAADVAVAPGE